MSTARAWKGAALAVAVAALWAGGCMRDWNKYDPRLGTGGHGGGSSSAGTGGTGGATASSGGTTSSTGGGTSSTGGASSSTASSASSTSSASSSAGSTSSASSASSASSSTGGPTHCGGTNVLSYNFPGSDPGGIWSVGMGGGATVSQMGGEGVVTLPSGAAAGSEGHFYTNRYYDLRTDAVSVEVTSAGNTATTAATYFSATLNGSNYLQIYQQSGTIHFVHSVGGVWTSLKSTLYNPATHLYWRFREDGTNTYWETSADGTTWATQGQVATTSLFSLQYLQIQLTAQTSGGEVSPGSVHFAKVNGGGTPVGQWCPVASLTDNFSGTTRGPQWIRSYTSAPETVAQGGGLLTFTLAANATKYSAYGSSASYQLTGSAILVHVPTVPNTASNAQGFVALDAPGNNQMLMLEENGQLIARIQVGGTSTDVGSVLYDAAQHAWWRIRESGGTVFWETAPDGKAWTAQQQLTPLPFAIDALDVQLAGGTWKAEAMPGTVVFANLNLPPP